MTVNENKRQHLLLKNIPGLFYVGTSPILEGGKKDGNTIYRNIPLHLSLLTGLAGLNIFTNRRNTQTMVEIKQFSNDGTLVSIDRPKKQSGKKETVYTFSKRAMADGYITFTIDNLSNKHILTSNYFSVTSSLPKVKIKWRPLANPVVNSETPTDINVDGGWLGPVTIIRDTPNGEFTFQASYEANFGPSATWTVSGGAGGYGGDGGNSGGAPAADPGPEEKKIVRELNEFGANKCEARYILDHLTSDPLMSPKLISTRIFVQKYMNSNGMPAANDNGSAKENAFKHALFSAYNFCEIGREHSNAMANFHEVCEGVNQNPTNAEWFMDDYNNHKGFEIAKNVGCGNLEALIPAVKQAYNHGILHDINGHPTAP